MKKSIVCIAVCIAACLNSYAQTEQITKTGLNVGPLPAVAYDADKGLQLGAVVQLFNYGDGSNYPNYDSKWYLEASFFTKGSQLYNIMYDNKVLIPGIRWSNAITIAVDKGMDFYGFNGYGSYLDYASIAAGKAGDSFLFSPFYKMNRTQVLAKSDFIGEITKNFKWEAGYHASYFGIGAIDYANVNKNKSEQQCFPTKDEDGYVGTLYENFVNWGIITPEEANGGFSSSVRLGLVYDTRDKEGAPASGIWAEGHLTAAPKWLGTQNPFYRYSITFRNYLPIVTNDILTFAYRLNYEGTIGNSAPFYVLPYITVMGENGDKDGMGGYRTVRGLIRDRVVGLDMATYTAELRWRFAQFKMGRQNIALGLSCFSDGTMATRGLDMTFKGEEQYKAGYESFMAQSQTKDTPHITTGAGFRFIMNENFIVAAEYGTPISHFYSKTNPLYNQDGTGAFYINVGYLF